MPNNGLETFFDHDTLRRLERLLHGLLGRGRITNKTGPKSNRYLTRFDPREFFRYKALSSNSTNISAGRNRILIKKFIFLNTSLTFLPSIGN
jgi:hypothetical protein